MFGHALHVDGASGEHMTAVVSEQREDSVFVGYRSVGRMVRVPHECKGERSLIHHLGAWDRRICHDCWRVRTVRRRRVTGRGSSREVS
jgi:hypothetical protein